MLLDIYIYPHSKHKEAGLVVQIYLNKTFVERMKEKTHLMFIVVVYVIPFFLLLCNDKLSQGHLASNKQTKHRFQMATE